MFILETNTTKAAKTMSVLIGILFALTALGSFGALATMHIYVKPRPLPSAAFVCSASSWGVAGDRKIRGED
jgi:hypothetical protein